MGKDKNESKKSPIKIQRGFIAGMIAVAVVAVATGGVIKYMSNADASIISSKYSNVLNDSQSATSNINRCLSKGVPQTSVEQAELTDKEKTTYGDKANAYNIKINKKKASFRLVVAANPPVDSLESKTENSTVNEVSSKSYTQISYALTFNDFENKNTWGGNNDRMVLSLTDGTVKTDTYNRISKGSTYSGSFKIKYAEGDNLRMHIEFIGKNYDGCVASALVLPRDYQTSSPTPTPTATTSASPAPTATTTSTQQGGYLDLTLRSGFNAVYLPEGAPLLSTEQLEKLGMKIWAFNRDGSKNWITTGSQTEVFHHSIGYYVQNPGATRKVSLTNGIKTPDTTQVIYDGWNLLANSSDKSKKLSEMKYMVDPCPDTGTDVTCMAEPYEVRLSDYRWGMEDDDTAFGVYVIDDPYASDADKAFDFIDVDEDNVDTVTIPAGKLFWMYIWP